MSAPAAVPAPIIVTALFGREDAAWLTAMRTRHFPPERNHLDAHLTLFHHLSPELAPELKQRLSALTRGCPPPRAELAGVMSLGRGTAFRVESPELEEIRAELADAFRGMLMPQDQAGWRPHVTIQNKVEPRDTRALQAAIEADFTPRPLMIAGLCAWWYRGGSWEILSRHMFA